MTGVRNNLFQTAGRSHHARIFPRLGFGSGEFSLPSPVNDKSNVKSRESNVNLLTSRTCTIPQLQWQINTENEKEKMTDQMRLPTNTKKQKQLSIIVHIHTVKWTLMHIMITR